MNTVALKIKNLRITNKITQNQMAEKVHLSLRAWQKIENGITRLDLDRLAQIATVLEISICDLINSVDGVSIQQRNENIKIKQAAIETTMSESERNLFNRIIADKDREIDFLRNLLKKKK